MHFQFRKTVWIKRGDFALCQPIEEGEKVRAEIVHILYRDNIRYIQKNDLWPERFAVHLEQEPKDKRNNDCGIDADLLPPSESEDSDLDEDEETCHQ